jgi:hypothetical protein
MPEPKKHTADDLVALIRAKYSGTAYVVLEQVADGTGGNCSSWVDAAVFSVWPSNGIWRAAFEVKVSRADLLKELANPKKNQWAREHFDFFWYVVAPGVAKDDEIPTGCGLLAVHGDGLKIVKQAPRREKVKTDNTIVASFARSLDKERERLKYAARREAVESDGTYREAVKWMDGARKYIRGCNEYHHAGSAEEVFDLLVKCGQAGSPSAADNEQVQAALSRFQDHVVEFLLNVAPLAANVLNARDEAGEFVIGRWGGHGARTAEALKSILKPKRRLGSGSRNQNREFVEARKIIAKAAKGDG